ncbi:MAG TPA: hypothetical protein VKA46_33840 [Gemmataceae bacterium]|nr:hypothetical protein [Gemmataceae bacterium]
MSNATTIAPRRQRSPLQPVNVRARFVGGATRQDVIDGAAVLSITSGDATDQDESAYWVEGLFLGDKCLGFRLRKFGSEEVYDVPRALDSCTCADATYRPERPGGCKHQVSLRQTLPTVSKAVPVLLVAVLPRPVDRKSERDEATAPPADSAA